MEKTNWRTEARERTQSLASELSALIVEQLIQKGKASDDVLNDYEGGDDLHHSIAVDDHYGLSEATDLLDDLSDFEEGDSGLWKGQSPRDAISTQAAFTLGKAVHHYWAELIATINDDFTVEFAARIETDFNLLEEREKLEKFVDERILAFA